MGAGQRTIVAPEYQPPLIGMIRVIKMLFAFLPIGVVSSAVVQIRKEG